MMRNEPAAPERTLKLRLSLDTWAVAIAFLLALIVRAGLVKHIPW
jgi:hypothetical protein